MCLNKIRLIFLLILVFMLNACVTTSDVERPTQNKKASDLNVQLGIGYLQQNNLEVANQKLSKALIQNPESAVAHNAFAILQERLLQKDKAEMHYRLATELDETDSSANNNYGRFLCNNNRQAESEKYFLRAVSQPLYRTPEFAYTNAASCLMQIKKYEKAEQYLIKALAARNNFANALINISDLYNRLKQFEKSDLYLKRFHLVKNKTSKSVWLAIQNNLELGNDRIAQENINYLAKTFPSSKEYKDWKSNNK